MKAVGSVSIANMGSLPLPTTVFLDDKVEVCAWDGGGRPVSPEVWSFPGGQIDLTVDETSSSFIALTF